MEKEKKYFLAEDSQLNSDDGAFAVSPNSWVNAVNVRTKSTDTGVTGTVESIGGTLLLSTPQPSITFLTNGGATDVSNSRFITFKVCTTGPWHKIVCWDARLNQEFDVLLSSQVTGGLNFDKDYFIHSARVVNGLLYWTENLNAQRKINIDAGIKLNNPSYVTDVEAYTLPIAPEVITVLRKPPEAPLTINKVTQTSPALVNNFIEHNAFQFSFRYYYKDGETSVPSVYSLLAPYNSKGQTFNRIDVFVPVIEYIEQDVQSVDILVKYGNENTFYRVKSWDKSYPSEAQEIIDHNSGLTPLTFLFYNDTIGEAQDVAYSIKPFDSVPILSETLETFDNRLGFGNNLSGYDTPKTTSLDAQVYDQSDGAVPVGRWVKILYGAGATHYYLDLGDLGFFDSFVQPPPFPASVVYGTLTHVASGPASFAFYISMTLPPPWTNGIEYTGDTSSVTGAPSPVSLVGARCFKSGAFYKLATTFYDFGDRKCGITGSGFVSGVATGQITLQIPNRVYDSVSYVTAINWTLSNANALNEIPDWATHYSVDITNCLSTRFFLQARSKNTLSSMCYVDRDDDNAYTFTTTTYDATLTGVGVDITNLQNFGMGYVFAEGDLINIYINSDPTVYTLSIIAQDGRWLICELQDLGTLTATTDALFQIYTPYIQQFNEPYYEVANYFPITNAGTSSRIFSNTAGSIRGDVTLLDRGTTPTNYLAEAMSPNDKFYQRWYTDAGRPNFIDRIGQQLEETKIQYSNVLTPGTKTNGLSSFDALDARDTPQQCGAIMKLQITSKVQDEIGIVMLAICGSGETVSLYIGEVQLYGSNAPSTLAQAPNVIGTMNVLKGSRGTNHPESVTEYRGNVFWWDDINGKIVQYGSNGLFDISDYKMTRFWNLFSLLFRSKSVAEIEALGSRPYVFTSVDPLHDELLISIPKLSNTPPKGYLPDYPNEIFPFDIWDAQGKTIVYKLGKGDGRPYWIGSYSFNPEYFITLQNKLYSCKYGHIYLHNQSNYNEFYGIQYSSKIMVVANALPNKPKLYNNVASESNLVPSFVYLYNNQPLQQSSDIVDLDFKEIEGGFFSYIFRNKLIPTAIGYTTDGLLTGKKMRNASMWIMFEWRVTTIPLELRFLNIGYTVSLGYNI